MTVDFYSPALRREADYLVYLPPGYDPARHRYPVYYLLHGSPGRPRSTSASRASGVRLDNLIAEHRMRPMILVFPDGRIDGSTYSDSEWANTPSGDYESYVLDVVARRRLAASPRSPTARDRVIAGFSAGAYGATNIALHNLTVFGNLQSWSGYYLETRTGVFAHASPAALADNSPLDYVRRLRPPAAPLDPLRAFLFTGRDDNSSPQLDADGRAPSPPAGASVSYALYHGGHDWQLWHAHLDQMLILASRGRQPAAARGSGRAQHADPGCGADPARPRAPPPPPPPSCTAPVAAAGARRRRLGLRAAAVPRAARSACSAAPAPGGAAPAPATARRGAPATGSAIGLGVLLGGLLLALGSAALINLGFLLQHRGLGAGDRAAGWRRRCASALRNRTWLAGQALGWSGFAAQIVAVAIAPLSLVQAFAAGGLALSVPLAARLFAHRITRPRCWPCC